MRNNVRQLRIARNISQAELARRSEITRPYLSNIERGVSVPCTDVGLRICRVLGVPVEKVFLLDADAVAPSPFDPFPTTPPSKQWSPFSE